MEKSQVLPFRWTATVEEELCAETANENHIAQKSINHLGTGNSY